MHPTVFLDWCSESHRVFPVLGSGVSDADGIDGTHARQNETALRKIVFREVLQLGHDLVNNEINRGKY